jgi:hypothetical protein
MKRLLCLSSLVLFLLPSANASMARPNIVLILADDLGMVDINAYAARFTRAKPAEMFYETPHLDRLVREGVAFSQAYASHLCSPARVSVLTGKNAARRLRGRVRRARGGRASCLVRNARNRLAGDLAVGHKGMPGPGFAHRAG